MMMTRNRFDVNLRHPKKMADASLARLVADHEAAVIEAGLASTFDEFGQPRMGLIPNGWTLNQAYFAVGRGTHPDIDIIDPVRAVESCLAPNWREIMPYGVPRLTLSGRVNSRGNYVMTWEPSRDDVPDGLRTHKSKWGRYSWPSLGEPRRMMWAGDKFASRYLELGPPIAKLPAREAWFVAFVLMTADHIRNQLCQQFDVNVPCWLKEPISGRRVTASSSSTLHRVST